MAQSMETIRGLMRTSIHGRRLGIDGDEHLAGVRGVTKVVTDASSATTGTALPNHGFVSIDSTDGDTFTLTAPKAGVAVDIVSASTGGALTITPVSGTFKSSASSTGETLTLTGQAGVRLLGVSTALWIPVARYGSSAQVHVTT